MIRILTLGIQFFMLNSRQTNDEKKAVVKELKEFSKAATDLLDSIVIPE